MCAKSIPKPSEAPLFEIASTMGVDLGEGSSVQKSGQRERADKKATRCCAVKSRSHARHLESMKLVRLV
jgi:hypothetical protein